MKIKLEVTLSKGEGPKQDPHSVREMLVEAVDSLGSFWVQDPEHDDETEYNIDSVEWQEVRP